MRTCGGSVCARFPVADPVADFSDRSWQPNFQIQNMNSAKAPLANPTLVLTLVMAGLVLPGVIARAQDAQHLPAIQAGGMPGLPVITGISRASNGVSVSWYGAPGYYQLYQKLGLKDAKWTAVGGLNLSNRATITTLASNAFFRVLSPPPQYAGAQVCSECHQDTHTTVMSTRHTGAFTDSRFVAQGGQTNTACLACHSVGYGLPTGFVNGTRTPQLAGVQCENCHGPAGNHAANPEDFTAVPRAELAGTLCGGCHNASLVPASAAAAHPPRFEEWNASPHRAVLDDLITDFNGSQGASLYIPSCGRCHSGAVREAFVDGAPLPNGHEASAVGIVCATCHDPHQVYVHTNVLNGLITNQLTGVVVTNQQVGAVYTNQVISPFASMKDYFLSTSDVFTNKYDPNINVCAQCHNHRGAAYTSSSRPPHLSPQYNMLLGTVGELSAGPASGQPSTHALLEKQCVACHMQTADYVGPTQPAVSGHHFKVELYTACQQCHPLPELLVEFTSGAISNQIQQVKASLDLWATTKAKATLRTKYGALAWEYTNPGALSTGGPGPSASEQADIPDTIQKARFDLYLVLNDGSYGVHNGPYAKKLLETAQSLIQAEMSK